MQLALITATVVSVLLTVFFMVIYYERAKWNQLIAAGILPKPKKG